MSASASAVISIGAQTGPRDGGIAELKVQLCRALAKRVTSTHCPAIDEYAIVLRVDSPLQKFGEEGLARLRLAKKKRYITVDVQIPEAVWVSLSRAEIKAYLARQVRAAVLACVSRLQNERFPVQERALAAEIDASIADYLAEGM